MDFRFWIFLAGLLGAAGVILGALGAHVFADSLEGHAAVLFEKAWRYHMLHVFGLLFSAWLIWLYENGLELRSCWIANLSAWMFLAGIVLFSGVLYLQALVGGEPRVPIVPVGGTCFIIGWLLLATSGVRIPKV